MSEAKGMVIKMTVEDPVLIHQWHPVLRSADLTDSPVAVEVLGVKIVVF